MSNDDLLALEAIIPGGPRYPYGPSSQRHFDTLHFDWKIILRTLQDRVDHTVVFGHRSKADQDHAFEQGLSKLRWPDSKHNSLPSMAVDVAPYFAEIRGIDWEDTHAVCTLWGRIIEISERLIREGTITHRVRWGGDWDGDGRTRDQSFMDFVHGELIPLTEEEIAAYSIAT